MDDTDPKLIDTETCRWCGAGVKWRDPVGIAPTYLMCGLTPSGAEFQAGALRDHLDAMRLVVEAAEAETDCELTPQPR